MVAAVDKLRAIEELWGACTACAISRSRTQVVFTRGDPRATLGIVGEAPGVAEDTGGVPFIGRSGELLDSLCERAGFNSDSALLFNVVGCRPEYNRKPTYDEIASCRMRTASIVASFRPRALLLLGATALMAVTTYSRIGQWRGKQIKAAFPWRSSIIEIDAVATYHPAYLLRAADETLERLVINDIRKAYELASSGSWLESED